MQRYLMQNYKRMLLGIALGIILQIIIISFAIKFLTLYSYIVNGTFHYIYDFLPKYIQIFNEYIVIFFNTIIIIICILYDIVRHRVLYTITIPIGLLVCYLSFILFVIIIFSISASKFD